MELISWKNVIEDGKKMRILFIAPTNTMYAGDTLSLGQLILGLKKNGIGTLVITSSEAAASVFRTNGALCKVLAQPEFKMTAIACPVNSIKNFVFYPYFYIRDIYRLSKTTKAIKSIVLEFKPDIIHSNTGPVIAGYFISKKYSIPHVWHIREFLDIDFNVKLIISRKKHLKMMNSVNNHVVFITECIKKHYANFQSSKVIYDGVLPQRQVQFIKAKSDYFLFVGKITERKGTKLLVESFVEIIKKHTNIRLLVVGEPLEQVYKNKLVSYIKHAGLSEKIIFLGNRNDVFDLMAKAIALIVPSVCEAFGRITVEAMYNGCLVIGNRTAGTREILESANLGLLFTGKYELIKLIREVTKNGIEHYFPTIRKAQCIAKDLYSQEQNAMAVLEYYESILKGKVK